MAESDSVVEVLAAYGVPPDVLTEYDCQPLRARIVKDTVKVRTTVGTRALKKVQLPDEALSQAFACAEHVAGNGMYRVPRFIKTIYGDPYVAHPSGLFYLTSWLPGRQPNLRRPGELYQSAHLLGQWHRCAAGQPWPWDRPATPEPLIASVQRAAPELRSFRDHVSPAPRHSAFDKLFLASADELQERIAFALEELEVVSTNQMGAQVKAEGFVCHGNFRRSSVLFDGEAWAILNYEHVHPGHPLHEFALFLHRTMPAYAWDVEVLTQTVAAYESAFRSLQTQREWLAALLSVPARPLQVVSWYYRQTQPWDEEDYVDALEAALEVEEARETARMSWLEGSLDPVRSRAKATEVVAASSAVAAEAQTKTLDDAVPQSTVQDDWAPAVDHATDQAAQTLTAASIVEVMDTDTGGATGLAGTKATTRTIDKNGEKQKNVKSQIARDVEGETLVIRSPRFSGPQRRARLTRPRAGSKAQTARDRHTPRPGIKLWGDAAPPEPD